MMSTHLKAALRRQSILNALDDGPMALTPLALKIGSPRGSIEANVELLVRLGKIERRVVDREGRRIAVVGHPGFDPDDAEVCDQEEGNDRPIMAEILRVRLAQTPDEEHERVILHLLRCWSGVAV